jgi:hypothetical protein
LATARDPIDAVGTMKFPGDMFLVGFMAFIFSIAVIVWLTGPHHTPPPLAAVKACEDSRVITLNPEIRCAKP